MELDTWAWPGDTSVEVYVKVNRCEHNNPFPFSELGDHILSFEGKVDGAIFV